MRSSCPVPALALLLMAAACSPSDSGESETPDAASTEPSLDWTSTRGPGDVLYSVTGLSGPEAVRYDPDQDVWFVSNFNGDGGERDANGFISRVSADGQVEALQFIAGGRLAPLHAPRGMNISGDTLWVADVDGVHGFHRATGEQLSFTDFTALEPGFLNDIAVGPGGAVYVTDTGASVVYRMEGGQAAVFAELPEEGRPNGITWDGGRGLLLTVAWGGGHVQYAVDPASGQVTAWTEITGGNFDGIERIGDRALVASQVDSSLHVVDAEGERVLIQVPGRPADIAVDTRRNRVAVPYIALDRVDVWQLPTKP